MENYYTKPDLVCRNHLQCTELIFKWREGDVVLYKKIRCFLPTHLQLSLYPVGVLA